MKINYKYKNFYLKFLLINIKFYFDCLLFFKKVYLFKSKSNFDLLNNFDDYFDKLKQSETFSNVKNYFSDREIWSAIRK